jgi:1-acyl-sn-glycerol-3-phosphate acyltransferase
MVRLLIFIPVLILDTVIHAAIVMVSGLFNPYSRFNSTLMRSWARIILFAAGVRLTVEGKENIQPNTSYIVVGNHQSHMDIPVLIAALPLPIRIISKKELFKIPVFGWGMRAVGILEIDRSNRKQAIETLNRAAEIIRQHHLSILAFPEGTRSPDGKIHPFKKGPIILAINTKISILPVTVSGTYRILPKKSLKLRSGRVKVVIHPPYRTDHLTLQDRHRVVQEIHDIVASKFEENYG